ncbi:hypothetical protein GCM10007937_41460 [Mesorhizobium albiziae]|nr:hypothetical protein GCM10007937_41460 [Mesorhizobium albiziae]
MAGDARGLGIDRQRKPRLEMEVTLDAETKRPFDAFKFGKADAAEFRAAEAEIARPNSISPSALSSVRSQVAAPVGSNSFTAG